jgi:hypothetical protein
MFTDNFKIFLCHFLIYRRGGGKKKRKSNCNMNEKGVIKIVAEFKRGISKLITIAKQVSQIIAVSQRSNCHLFNIVLLGQTATI